MVHFILSVVWRYRFRCFFALLHALLVGYFTPFWPFLLEKSVTSWHHRFYLIALAFFIFSFNFIIELFLFPVINFAILQTKNMIVTFAHSKDLDYFDPGSEISKFQRPIFAFRLIFRETLKLFKFFSIVFSSLILFFQFSTSLAISVLVFVGLFFLFSFFILRYSFRLRLAAWDSTDLATSSALKSLNQTLLVRKICYTTSTNKVNCDTSASDFDFEFKSWGKYFFELNFFNVFQVTSIVLFLIFLFLFFTLDAKVLFIFWNLATQLVLVHSFLNLLFISFVDLFPIFSLLSKSKSNNKSSFYLVDDFLEVKDFSFFLGDNQAGPFNFKTASKFIIFNGPNGVGKTRCALAISNLIPFTGILKSPKSIYLGPNSLPLDSSVSSWVRDLFPDYDFSDFSKLSRGQLCVLLIDQILSQNFSLIIFDEILDSLSSDLLSVVLNRLRAQNKMFVIITHRKEILDSGEIWHFTLDASNLVITR